MSGRAINSGVGRKLHSSIMKIDLKMAFVAVLASILPMALSADNLFRLTWHGKVYSSGANGVIVRPFTEKEFVQKVAANNNLNPNSLMFVYRPDKHDTVVVQAANGAFVADVIKMEYQYTEATNSAATQTVRQALLYDEAHNTPLGSAFGTEKIKRDASGNITGYSFRGTFQYSMPENNLVYSGTFVANKRVIDKSSQQDQQDTSNQQTNTTATSTSQ